LSLRRKLPLVASAGISTGVAAAFTIAGSDHADAPVGWLIAIALVIGWGFIGVGLVAWARRPDNRVGALMAITGFAFLVGGLGYSNDSVVFTIGALVGSIYLASAIHLLLAFPSGRLSAGDRRIVVAAYVLTATAPLVSLLFADPEDYGCDGCPDNVVLVTKSDTVLTVAGVIVNLIGVTIIAAVIVSLVQRWRAATAPQRRQLAPIFWTGLALLGAVAVTVAFQTGNIESELAAVSWLVALVPFGLVPYILLGSMVRSRVLQGGAVGELVSRIGAEPPGALRDDLATALADPTLELVYWLPGDERFVDAAGQTVELPGPGSGRAVTKVEREGGCVAALIHDESLLDDPGHVRAVGGAAALALENERLEAELRAKVDELYESRARLVRAGLAERRQLERNLHDGAQQRLVSLALSLRMARTRMESAPREADAMLDAAEGELEAALEELRELARGIHPAVLSDRGLGPALEALAHRAPLPVSIEGCASDGLPEAVQLAAYYVVAEALTNVAKYADANHATVSLERHNGRLVVEIEDDGVGGADPARGSGLQGLADRLSGLDGRLEVDSRPGEGTTVRAKIPCG
jgi:signal transduction histidine kinase